MSKIIPVCIWFLSFFFLISCGDIDNFNQIAGVENIKKVVSKPKEGDSFEIGKNGLINWDIEKGEYIKIDLLKDGEFIKTIAKKVNNTDDYLWSFINEEEFNTYSLKLTIVDGTYAGRFCESDMFAISNWHDLGFESPPEVANPSLVFDKNGQLYITFHTGTLENIQNRFQYTMLLYKWDEEHWSANLLTETKKSFTYEMNFIQIDQEQVPVLIYGEFPESEYNAGINAYLKKYVNGKWVNYDPVFDGQEDCQLDELEPCAFSMTLNGNDPIIFYLTPAIKIPDGYYGIYDWKEGPWYLRGKKWDSAYKEWRQCYSGDYINQVNFFIDIYGDDFYEELYNEFFTLNTALAIDSDGNYYVAYSDTFEIDLNSKRRIFRVSKGSEQNDHWVWESINPELIDFPVYYFTMTIGLNNLPVIAYLKTIDEDNDIASVEVIEWDTQSWVPVGQTSFPSLNNYSPAMYSDTIDNEKVLVLAYCDHVKIWDGYTWENLGYPGRGKGDPSSWIGANEDYFATVFKARDDKIHVKVKYKEE